MKVLKYDEMIPEVYVKESRDFQLMTRLWSIALNGAKYNADKLQFQNTPLYTDAELIPLLQEKVGFISNSSYINAAIREVCKAFYTITRNKGSLEALSEAIRLYFRSYHIYTNASIQIINKTMVNVSTSIPTSPHSLIDYDNSYIVRLGINSSPRDVSLLQDICRFVIPTGYILQIHFYQNREFEEYIKTFNSIYYLGDTSNGALFHGITPTNSNYTGALFIINAVDTTTFYSPVSNNSGGNNA